MPSRILTCYYRPKPGGFCKRLFRAIEALLACGHSVHYLAVVPFPIEHPNCHFHHFPWPEHKTSGYLFWAVFHLLSPLLLLYLSFRYRVERLFAFGYTYSLLLQPIRLIKNIPLVLFLRGDTLEKHRVAKKPDLLIRLEFFLEGTGIAGTEMFGVSEFLTKKLDERHSFFRARKTGVIRNDIPAHIATNSEKSPHVPLRAACVGVLEVGKNQRFLLRIIKKLRAKQIQLYLYGNGPDETNLKCIAEKENIADQVVFKGWVQSEHIWPEIDLLLMPSQHEGAPNAVLEALATGTPVLASDIPEHREILLSISLLSLADEKAWINRLREIIQDPEVQLKQLVAAQESASKHLRFDWDEKIVNCIVQEDSCTKPSSL